MAGQKDSNGGIVEMLNCFINKKLLNSIDNIVILIPFTQANIKDSRGNGMRDQLEMIVTSFQNNLSEISNSIVPILTKFNPEN